MWNITLFTPSFPPPHIAQCGRRYLPCGGKRVPNLPDLTQWSPLRARLAPWTQTPVRPQTQWAHIYIGSKPSPVDPDTRLAPAELGFKTNPAKANQNPAHSNARPSPVDRGSKKILMDPGNRLAHTTQIPGKHLRTQAPRLIPAPDQPLDLRYQDCTHRPMF